MNIKKAFRKIHLWLGLISGFIIFIVCLTGATWALHIHGWVDPEPKYQVDLQEKPMLMPDALVALVKDTLGCDPTYVTYTQGEATRVGSYSRKARASALLNPYSGEIYQVEILSGKKERSFDFWHFIRMGHRTLWLPGEIGRPIVNYGTLTFVFVLISGIFIWWPKTKKAAKNRLTLNWKKKTPFKRRVFDLHTVLGFYCFFFLLLMSLTGMVWGIKWYSEGLYGLTTGGKKLPAWDSVQSDKRTVDKSVKLGIAVNTIFLRLLNENPHAASISINFPDKRDSLSVVTASVNKEKDIYYNRDSYAFDRYTFQEIKTEGPYNGKYESLGWGDKLRRMTYEIHIGAVWGTPGRILVFLAALFGASLPFTGIYIWIKSRRQKAERKTIKQ